MRLSCLLSPNISVSPSNKKLTTITQSPEHSAEKKLSKSKQLQQVDSNCSVSKSLDKIICDLERVFNYDDYDKKNLFILSSGIKSIKVKIIVIMCYGKLKQIKVNAAMHYAVFWLINRG